MVEDEHLEVDALREPPEELPVGLVVLLDEVVGGARAVDRPLVHAGALPDLPRDVRGGHVLVGRGALGLVEQVRAVVGAEAERRALAELGLERGDHRP